METVISQAKVSIGEFRTMLFDDNDEYYYELINGEMIQKSAPSPKHQEVSRNLLFALETFNRQKKIGSIFYAPLDVYFDEYNKPQPDIVFVSTEKKDIINKDGIKGVPDLIIEIISPSSFFRDRIEKKALYEKMLVHECWLVDPQNETIEIYALKNKQYELISGVTTSEGELKSLVFKGLTINVKDIFSNT